jgi:hypothetical protein
MALNIHLTYSMIIAVYKGVFSANKLDCTNKQKKTLGIPQTEGEKTQKNANNHQQQHISTYKHRDALF